MYVPYSKNPYLPKVRQDAVNLVLKGWSTRKVARHFGLASGTVSKWLKRDVHNGLRPIPTLSSKPHHHPYELRIDTVDTIIFIRKEHGRCAEIVHQEMLARGFQVSFSSVRRTLERNGLINKRSPWKRWHVSLPRPEAQNAGDLIQIDTIHVGPADEDRIYVYTLLDVFSRWAYATVSKRINTYKSLWFVKQAQIHAPFQFHTLQSDHGSEFSTYFSEHIQVHGLAHRHSRVRMPNDNAHLERFNRTIQEECLDRIPKTLHAYRREIPEYLRYYNTERMHLGLNYKTPLKCVQAID